MIFLATEFRDGGRHGHRFEADDWAEAESICDGHGWELDGEFIAEIPASMMDDLAGIVEQLQRGGLN